MNPQIRIDLLRTMRNEAFAFVRYMLLAEQARQIGREELATLLEETAQSERNGREAEANALAWLADSDEFCGAVHQESCAMESTVRGLSWRPDGPRGDSPVDSSQSLQSILDMIVQVCGADFGLLSLSGPGADAVVRAGEAGGDGKVAVPESLFYDLGSDTGIPIIHISPIFSSSNEFPVELRVPSGHSLGPARLEWQLASLCAVHAAGTLEAAQNQQALRDLNTSLEWRVAERTAQLKALALELKATEHRERTRLAQELHDNLQQLLVAAKMQAGIALSDPNSTAAIQQVIGLTDEALSCCHALVNGLSPPMLRDANLHESMKRLAGHMRGRHGLDVQVVVDEPQRLTSEGLRILLFEIARELLFNIVKHAEIDQAVLRVGRENGCVLLEVADDGAGCDPSALENSGTERFGLCSIRERLTIYGGSIRILAAPERGCRIQVLVPDTAEDNDKEAAFDAGEHSPASPASCPDGVRVLLVDDHRILRQGMAAVLSANPGTRVIGQAGDGLEAVELTRKLEPDVVVMDVSMPRMDGIEATRCIRAEMPQVRVVGLSMYESDEMALAMKDAGAEAFLRKDDPLEHLLGVLRGV